MPFPGKKKAQGGRAQGRGLPGRRPDDSPGRLSRDVSPGLRVWRHVLSFAARPRTCPVTVPRLYIRDGWHGRHPHGAAWHAIKEEALFFVGSLTCLSIFLAWRLAAPWCAPFLAVCVTALLQVLAAMGGVYHEVRLAVAVLSFLSLLPVCLSLFAAGAPRRHYLRTAAPSLLFAGLLFLFAWHYAGARLVYWDEFFWGGFVKHLVLENSLWTWGSVLPRHDSVLLYPPMVTILQALLQPMGAFSEPAIALGEAAVLLSATGVVIHLARERGLSFWPVCFCALLTFGLLRSLGAHVDYGSYIFGYGESLQTALYTALALLVIFSSCRDRLLRLLLQGGCAVLILCKPTGILLVLCVLGAFALRQWFGVTRQRFRHVVWSIVSVVWPAVLCWGLWKVYRAICITGAAGADFSAMANAWGLETILDAIPMYAWAFLMRPLVSIPAIGLLTFATGTAVLLLLACGGSWYLLRKDAQLLPQGRGFAAFLLAAGFLAWVAVHAYATMAYMDARELASAASYERYAAVAMGPVLVGTFFLFLLRAAKQGHLWQARLVRFFSVALMAVVVCFSLQRPADIPGHLAEMEQAARILQQATPEGSSWWLVAGKASYEYGMICRYLVMPERRAARVSDMLEFNPVDSLEERLLGGTLPADLRATARRQKVDYLLLWRVPADFVARYGKELGLYEGEAFPLLLRLDAWREGKREVPEKIVLPAELGR